MLSAIYKIENVVSGRVYIGSATNFALRQRWHTNELKRGRHCNEYLQADWNEYGPSSFVFSVVLTCGPKYLLFFEQAMIDGYRQVLGWNNLYNISTKAGKLIHTPEVKAKLSKSHTGRKRSDEHRRHISEALKGREFSEETKQLLSKAALARQRPSSHSATHKANISEGLRRAHQLRREAKSNA